MTAKEQVISKIEELPNGATLADIREEIEILSAIEEGLEDVRNGRTQTQNEVKALFGKWIIG